MSKQPLDAGPDAEPTAAVSELYTDEHPFSVFVFRSCLYNRSVSSEQPHTRPATGISTDSTLRNVPWWSWD
jgi:hypothetical protein